LTQGTGTGKKCSPRNYYYEKLVLKDVVKKEDMTLCILYDMGDAETY
jgi:hypothetical protein